MSVSIHVQVTKVLKVYYMHACKSYVAGSVICQALEVCSMCSYTDTLACIQVVKAVNLEAA